MVKKTGMRKGMRGGGMVKKTGMRGGGMVKKTGMRKAVEWLKRPGMRKKGGLIKARGVARLLSVQYRGTNMR
jgi:hypothetical protein